MMMGRLMIDNADGRAYSDRQVELNLAPEVMLE